MRDDDIAALERVDQAAFGYTSGDDEPESPFIGAYRGRWGRVALDGDAVVGGFTAFDLEVAVPGGADLAAPGVTSVAVAPTHHRRGIMRELMTTELARYREDGFAVALLTASEAAIYGRFGFGVATEYRRIEVDTRRAAWLERPAGVDRLHMVSGADAAAVVPAMHDAARRRRSGGIRRTDALTDAYLADPPSRRLGASGRFYAVHHDETGTPTGVLAWRTRQNWGSSGPHHVAEVEPIAVDDETERTLWAFAFSLDLVTTVSAVRPVDEWLPWALVDRRAVRTADRGDHLHVRILDLEPLVAARRFATSGAVAVSVDDPQFAEVGGSWLVEGGPDGGSAERTGRDAELRLGVGALASLLFGAASASALAAAGRLDATSPEALATADALFAVARAPFCDAHF